ncbi:MAG: LacI family DNA-binding transcriptional regulator [Actinobacteria bacterium]|nr:LacI family DNA-binding transcriptional regulator [Actinomycetota bacterium]
MSGADQRRGVTRADVARLAGVSTAVVSYTLNDGPKPVAAATKARVLEAVRLLGYRPNAAARALSTGQSDLLALVVPTVEQSYFAHLAAAVERAAAAHGLSLIVANAMPDRVAPVVRGLVGRQVRGLIIAAEATADATKEFLAAGTPTVVINQASPIGSLLTLGPDYRAGTMNGVHHLIEAHGHRRIAYLGGDVDGDERVRGWTDALSAAGLALGPALAGGFTPADGRTAMRALLREHPEVTAAFCASDQLAIGALAALAETGGRAPDDLALVSFDGSPEAEFAVPALTTVNVPIDAMAHDAVTRVLDDISAGHVRYEAELIVRRSCGCQ